MTCADKGREKRAIVVVSIGDRPWLEASLSTIRPYAGKCGADLVVKRDLPGAALATIESMPEKPGRPNKAAYACKTYFAWEVLSGGYDRVLMLDDTCCVAADAPDIFDATPREHMGYTGTGLRHAEKSFAAIERLVETEGMPSVPLDPRLYMNSAVLLYDKCHADSLRPDLIEASASLLYSMYPHQTLTYYLSRLGNFQVFRLPKSFNSMPALHLRRWRRRRLRDVRPYLEHTEWIYHITGAYRHRERLIGQVADYMLNARRPRDMD
jgi:hypothetical protein